MACCNFERFCAGSLCNSSAREAIRLCRADCSRRAPRALARIRVRRASCASAEISTRRLRARPATMRLIVGGLTCSAAASSPSVFAPPKTSTERAERRAGPSPVEISSLRTRRSRWMAAECRASANATISGLISCGGVVDFCFPRRTGLELDFPIEI